MSRNPYLSSSYTRSSRPSSRPGFIGGSLLGRSRSSATLGGFGASSYGSKLTPSSYIPQWQRSSSSTRLNSSLTNRTSPAPPATTVPTETATRAASATTFADAQESRDADDNWQSSRSSRGLNDNRTNLYKSTSSHSLADERNARDNVQETSSNVIVLMNQLISFLNYNQPFSGSILT